MMNQTGAGGASGAGSFNSLKFYFSYNYPVIFKFFSEWEKLAPVAPVAPPFFVTLVLVYFSIGGTQSLRKAQKDMLKGALILVLAGYIIAAAVFGSIDFRTWKLQQVAPTEPTVSVGIIDVKCRVYDSLDLSASPSADVFWYVNRNGWMLIGDDDTTVELTALDGGYIWAAVKPSSSYYVDASETMAKNQRVQAVDYTDVDGDGYNEFIFKINVANIPKSGLNNPTLYFYPYVLKYAKPALNTPSDISGIGTSTSTQYIEWFGTYSASLVAWAQCKVEVSINTTDTSKIQLVNVNVPGVGFVSGSQFGTPMRGANSLTWTYPIGNDLKEAAFMPYKANTLNKFPYTTVLSCSLSTGDKITVTLTVYGFTTAGRLETITDTVLISA